MRDTLIRLDVLEELARERHLDVAALGVVVEGGVVTLTGIVPSQRTRETALAAIGRVRGTRAIVDALFSCVGEDTGDARLAQRVATLAIEIVRPTDALNVKVEGGWIMLTGKIADLESKLTLKGALHRIPGVRGVLDLVETD